MRADLVDPADNDVDRRQRPLFFDGLEDEDARLSYPCEHQAIARIDLLGPCERAVSHFNSKEPALVHEVDEASVARPAGM